jgi:hypothetical protein
MVIFNIEKRAADFIFRCLLLQIISCPDFPYWFFPPQKGASLFLLAFLCFAVGCVGCGGGFHPPRPLTRDFIP